MEAARDWFADFVLGAGLANLALAVLALEAVAVLALRSRLGGRTAGLLVNAGTGAALMLIVRAALLDRSAWEIAALFTLAFGLHVLDGWLRLRRPAG